MRLHLILFKSERFIFLQSFLIRWAHNIDHAFSFQPVSHNQERMDNNEKKKNTFNHPWAGNFLYHKDRWIPLFLSVSLSFSLSFCLSLCLSLSLSLSVCLSLSLKYNCCNMYIYFNFFSFQFSYCLSSILSLYLSLSISLSHFLSVC